MVMPRDASTDVDRAELSLAEFLRERRCRINPETMQLGWYHRTARRIGKSVSQEELAEAAGITRIWYAQLESRARTRPSTKLLDRLADVLMLDEAARATLFRLVIPSLTQAGLQAGKAAAIDTFDWTRRCTQRLWSATSEREALDIAAEEAYSRFRRAGLIVAYVPRDEDGRWSRTDFLGRRQDVARGIACLAEYAPIVGTYGMDDFRCYPDVVQPGETFVREPLFDSLAAMGVGEEAMKVILAHGLDTWCYLHARIRSRHDFIAGIALLAPTKYAFSEEDHAIMSALTTLVSLAAS
jgi:transcriptional regulator with XRE-family HTH domain